MSSTDGVRKELKYTRGEKCILVHVIVTFAAILALVAVYSTHLWAAPHADSDAFRITRRAQTHKDVEVKGGEGGARAGLVSGGGRRACGAVLLRRAWAAAPAHCVAARAHPALAHLLPHWTIRYHHAESSIIKGIVHSQFNNDDFSINIGLFQQSESIFVDDLKLTYFATSDELLQKYLNNMSIVGWAPDSASMMERRVVALPAARCRRALAAARDLASGEFCVRPTFGLDVAIDHGAALVVGSEIRGFFAWGDRQGHLPFVILNIASYRDWIESFIL